jgi:hypothetical protein
LLDGIAAVAYLPKCDEYDDDYEVEFLPTACSHLENVPFQQYSETYHLTYHSFKKESYELAKGNSLPPCFSSFKLLKENSKVIIEGKECLLIPSHTDSLEQTNKELQLSVESESENKYVQKFKDMEKGAYDNEEMLKSQIGTFPLCFSSFKVLKHSVNNVSDKKPSRYDIKFEESSRLANKECLLL